MDLIWLFAMSLGASAFSAAVGLGGGLLLLGLMPLFVPIVAVVPIQGVVNFSSNASRSLFAYRRVHWRWLPATIAGGLSGTLLGWPLLGLISATVLQTLLAGFILLSVWTPILFKLGRHLNNQYLITLAQGFLALFVGSVAALSMPMLLLLARGLSLAVAIPTSAMQMSVLNLFRIAAFYAAGFQFSAYTEVIVAFVAGAIVGTFIGGRCQQYVPEQIGQWMLKALTTVLALWLLLKPA